MEKALMTASLVFVAGTLVACGGADGGGAPRSSSEEDFCAAFLKISEEASGDSSDTEAQIEQAKDAAEELADVGTPEGIPDDARKGFELMIQLIDEVESDASEEDLNGVFEELSEDEQKSYTSFFTYVSETCPELAG